MRFTIPLEALMWTLALVALGVFGPSLAGHFTFCVPTMLGFDGCMGCGIGRAIGLAIRGDWLASASAHPLGIPAVFILTYHIVRLTITANGINNKTPNNKTLNNTIPGAPHG